MADLEIQKITMKDEETGITFFIRPETEHVYVTYSEDCSTKLSGEIIIKNNTDAIKWFILDYIVGTQLWTQWVGAIPPKGTWQEIVDNWRGGFCSAPISFKLYWEETIYDEVSSRIDEGWFLILGTNTAGARINASSEYLLEQFPDKNLLVYTPRWPPITVTLEAIAPFCHVFDHWEVNGTKYLENPATITMDSNYHVTAYFEPAS